MNAGRFSHGTQVQSRSKYSKTLPSNAICPGHRIVEDRLFTACALFPEAPGDFGFESISHHGAENRPERSLGRQSLSLRSGALALRRSLLHHLMAIAECNRDTGAAFDVQRQVNQV